MGKCIKWIQIGQNKANNTGVNKKSYKGNNFYLVAYFRRGFKQLLKI